MKTQIIKIIPCLLAGFILSACVGAVNVPPDVADKGAKTTESDPVIKKTAVVIIDDKKPAHPCIANPFGDTCATAEFNDARKAVCVGSNSERCAPIIKRECEADSLDALCDGLAKYFTAQKTACGGEPNSERCTATTERICGADFLDAYCTNLTEYYPMQKTACESEPNAVRCKATIARICADDIFNPYCVNATAYHSARKTACVGEPNSERCTATTERVCGANIFNPYCVNAEAYHRVQYAFCKSEPSSYRCASITTRVCEADVLDVLCAGKTTYYPAQYAACISDNTNPRCTRTITRVCGMVGYHSPFADVLDALCNGLAKYFHAQSNACEYVPNSERCKATTARICGADIFNLYCDEAEAYYPAQKAACNGGAYVSNSNHNHIAHICRLTTTRVCRADALDTICDRLTEYQPARLTACRIDNTDPRCESTIRRVCEADTHTAPLDAVCNGLTEYYPAQKKACRINTHRTICVSTVERICGADSLDDFCIGLTKYHPMQKTACESEPNSERCAPTRARLCPDTPFDTACQENNLTGYDFYEVDGLNRIYWGRNNNVDARIRVRCYEGNRGVFCGGSLPFTGIDIKPLNDTNTGTAIYTGDLTIAYHNNDYSDEQRAAPNYEYEYAEQTININLAVNFGDNSLSYSGTIADNAFSINGSFTDRGHITGTANFRDTEAGLFGLIGQTEMIGAFRSQYTDKDFAGGFTATRE